MGNLHDLHAHVAKEQFAAAANLAADAAMLAKKLQQARLLRYAPVRRSQCVSALLSISALLRPLNAAQRKAVVTVLRGVLGEDREFEGLLTELDRDPFESLS